MMRYDLFDYSVPRLLLFGFPFRFTRNIFPFNPNSHESPRNLQLLIIFRIYVADEPWPPCYPSEARISCGRKPVATCSVCGGKKVVDCPQCEGNGKVASTDCTYCGGTGKKTCDHCKGTGQT
jgi:hypothetical protein